jgi:hypothetical protein
VHQVPPVPRFVLVHGFKHRYRKHLAECWLMTPTRAVQPVGRVETVVSAPINAVWGVISDVTRTGEWSHECRRVEWLHGATKAAPGVRFRGTNQAGPWRWARESEIVEVDAPRALVWRTIPTRRYPDSSEWRFDLEAVDGGTRIAQSYRVVRGSLLMMRLLGLLVPAHRDRSNGLTADLQRIGDVALRDELPVARE